MEISQNVFLKPRSVSDELSHLIQRRLSKGSSTISRRGPTIHDLEATIETLSTVARTCATVVADITAQGKETDPFNAVKEIENVLAWNEFLETIETTTSDPDFLFRAHRHMGTSQPTFVPELDVPFDLEFRRTFSINEFAELLAEHLNKTREENETCFISMSPILEWTVHMAGQKQRGLGQVADDVAGLAIFDVERLRQTSVTLFHVSDVLDFLASQGKGQLIAPDLQKWARNCDEYVLMGRIPNDGLVRWVSWEELSTSSAPLFANCFVKAYTLAKYREWVDMKHIELEDICQMIVRLGKALAGRRDDLLLPLIDLILRPGIHFWGFETNSSEDIVKARIGALVDEAALPNLSRLRI